MAKPGSKGRHGRPGSLKTVEILDIRARYEDGDTSSTARVTQCGWHLTCGDAGSSTAHRWPRWTVMHSVAPCFMSGVTNNVLLSGGATRVRVLSTGSPLLYYFNQVRGHRSQRGPYMYTFNLCHRSPGGPVHLTVLPPPEAEN
jgi:hypothetical protein